ncbi:hypothetical protein I3760_05G153400 [Carya illinoinensis]|nr:hypothetical protein I3760_05G153400 [Carya illinoinensis]
MDLGVGEVGTPGNSKPHQPSGQISHLALDIGGSLIKLVYFSTYDDVDDETGRSATETLSVYNGNKKYPALKGRLHFAKFETTKINDCLEFIQKNQLHLGGCQHLQSSPIDKTVIKATGGGAYKYADLFEEKLGICLDKEDEMDCLVAGANFLLKVDGDGKFERVSGTNVGGGTFWGLGRLLTNSKSFDELLELSHKGNNRVIDMLVGDIYGGMDYSKIGLSSTTIASSFGKAISDSKELADYRPEDIARSLLRMISNNIGQIWAQAYIFWRIFHSGSCLYHGHNSCCSSFLVERRG